MTDSPKQHRPIVTARGSLAQAHNVSTPAQAMAALVALTQPAGDACVRRP